MADRRELTDRILSVAGIVVAACALAITFYQVHVMRTQAAIAVWPHIELYNTMHDGYFSRVAYNTGLGPAVIRYLDIEVDGRPMHDWHATAAALTGDRAEKLPVTTTDLLPGFVLLQGEKLALLQISGPDGNAAQQHAQHFITRICYCSLYGSCWMSSYGRSVNRRVAHCPDGNLVGFYAGPDSHASARAGTGSG